MGWPGLLRPGNLAGATQESIEEPLMADHPSLDALELVETCFARLYRNAHEVFKLRKPVRLRLGNEPVDLSSIQERHAVCLEEERVDRLLAPDLVLGVVGVTRGPGGRLRFGGDGEPLDWALHMRRLPDQNRGDERLAAGRLGNDQLQAIAFRLAAFHESQRGPMSPDRDHVLERLRAQIEMRIEAPGWPGRTPLPPEVDRIEAWQLDFLDAEAERFLRRADSHMIREGHGDLALEHLFLDEQNEVRILTGLELGMPLGQADAAADIATLATDLAARHRVDLAERFVAAYARIANDFDLYPLLDFYSSLHAARRGKLEWLCADGAVWDSTRADQDRDRARRHWALALAAPRHPLLPPVLVAVGGQVASGKSTLARFIAERIGAPVVGSDPTRDFLLGTRVNEDVHEARWEEAYEPGFASRIYEEVIRRAGEVLISGRSVVIDGCFHSREERMRARSLAQRFERPFLFVEARVTDAVQHERLAERAARDAVPIDDWQQIADQLRDGWEPVAELSDEEHLVLDSALPLERNAGSIEARLPTWPIALRG